MSHGGDPLRFSWTCFLLAAAAAAIPTTGGAQHLPSWVVAPEAGRVLASMWAASRVTRQERVGCLGGRLAAETVWVDRAELLIAQDADSLTADGRQSIEICGPPAWIGSVHSHVRSTDDTAAAPRFSPGDRIVMSLWAQRWSRQGAFCVLYSERRAHCELYPPGEVRSSEPR